MTERTEPTTDQTETEVEAHAEEILPLQELPSPETENVGGASKSTASIVC
ncbi:hypothetical protein ACFW1A_37760 [Kitasatospora sp. NPDC058965]